jgi:endonuclease I
MTASLLACAAASSSARADIYEAPTNYYSTATATDGPTLKTQLRSIVSNMRSITYGDLRYSAPYTDPDPSTPGNILSVYSRTSISGTWDGVTWNREHTWPQSRLGASASNGTANIASDEFSIRPAKSSENSSRGNNSYGSAYGSGTPKNISPYFYPGDVEAGDVARTSFYMATRYSQLTLVNGTGNPTNREMGNLADLLDYNYADPPDTFERRRNHAVYGLAGDANSPAITNPYAQQNRNPYVDHPEWVWAVFGDGANDSRLSVAPPAADGTSSLSVAAGRVFVGSSVSLNQNVTISKAGNDPTYFSVASSTGVTTSMTGRFNAFRATDTSKSLNCSYTPDTSTPGLKSGTVTIDNLDITNQGAGTGALDGNDTVTLSATVLARSNASFNASSDVNTISVNFGGLNLGQTATQTISLYNLLTAAGFTAGLDGAAPTYSLTDGAADFSTSFSAFTNLAGGSSLPLTISWTPTQGGLYTGTYTLATTDDKTIPGWAAGTALTINVSGFAFSVVPEPSGLVIPLVCAAGLARRRR